jgi:signal transduction histidine kinase
MDALINDLLAYSRLTRIEFDLRPVSLGKAVAEALLHLEAEVSGKKAEVKVIEPLPAVKAHGPILAQIVENLVANALKFVSPGNVPRVTIRAEEKNGWARLWVEDNGIGIPPEYHEKIFLVFERLHGIESYPGTGIGLAIVGRGVARMGGKAGVESEPGKGSRFWVELPIAQAEKKSV